jgi:hypothetical protein
LKELPHRAGLEGPGPERKLLKEVALGELAQVELGLEPQVDLQQKLAGFVPVCRVFYKEPAEAGEYT